MSTHAIPFGGGGANVITCKFSEEVGGKCTGGSICLYTVLHGMFFDC